MFARLSISLFELFHRHRWERQETDNKQRSARRDLYECTRCGDVRVEKRARRG